jgi:holo-[acyl-carrier protein] synthase
MPDGGILGVGLDLVENDRMEEVLSRWDGRFRDRVFTAREQAYCEAKAVPWRHYAGRWAVKEAVSKAFGTGIHADLSWLDMEVANDPASGAPSVILSDKGQALAAKHNVSRVVISLSHTRHYAVAQAILISE